MGKFLLVLSMVIMAGGLLCCLGCGYYRMELEPNEWLTGYFFGCMALGVGAVCLSGSLSFIPIPQGAKS
jgi:hypothetical protein